MYLADVASGKVIRQLTKTAADPHFDSLEFLALPATGHRTTNGSCSPR